MQTGENGNQYIEGFSPTQKTAMASITPGSDQHSTNQASPAGSDHRRSSQTTPHGLSARSCFICRRRKVKCDKKIPCSNCTKAGAECTFPAPGRAPRKPRQGAKTGSEREVELLKRLRRLEGVVEELSGQVELEAVKQQSPPSDNSSPTSGDPNHKIHNVRVVGMDESTKRQWLQRQFRIGNGPPKTQFSVEAATQGIGRIVLDEGKSRYVSSPFWASITDEVEEIKEILEEQDFDSDSDAPAVPNGDITQPDHQSFIMGYSSSEVNLKGLHPLPSQISFYWQKFLENVHPLTMIMHRPTMHKTIKEVQANLDSLSPSTEALMFSIYFATVTSMSGEEVRTNFGKTKETLIRQYRFGTEQALAKAGFLNTSEIVTVQAFVLFLVCVRRHDDTRFVWSLTGLVIRIAQSLGLHRDGSKLGLSPFNTEMRRRLWWQVCVLDVRAAEDHGSDPSIVDFSYDTEYPSSVNDDELSPDMTEPPRVSPGASEMTFCLIRYEICSLTRKLTYCPPGSAALVGGPSLMSLEEKEAQVKETSLRLEDKYLKYCEDAGPLNWVAATVARLIIAKLNLIVYHPLTQPGKPSVLSRDIRDRLLMSSISILEYARVLETEGTKQWCWLFQTYTQWHAIAYILGELAEREPSVTVDRAWRIMDQIFNSWRGSVSHANNGMLWQPLRKLMARARKKREENARSQRPGTDLGIDEKHNTPAAKAYTAPGKFPKTISEQRLEELQEQQVITPDPPGINGNYKNTSVSSTDTPNITSSLYPLNSNANTIIGPQVFGMDMLAPEHVQLQIQQEHTQQPTPWLEDAGFLDLDLDMNDVNGEIGWQGWDDMVRDFQIETDNQMRDSDDGRGPAIGGIGNWW